MPSQRRSKVLEDIVFGRDSVKRRVVKYVYNRYRCPQCRTCFGADERFRRCNWYGWNVLAFYIYHLIELCIPQRVIVPMLNRLYGFAFNQSLNYLKVRAAEHYRITNENILKRLVRGRFIHVGETRANIKGKTAFVWVLTNGQQVAYMLTESREGSTIQELLLKFRGVLICDFYSVYDNIGRFRQRCLIHLIRELNDDLLGNPFDEEFKELAMSFGDLLKGMVETVDRFGPKSYFLRKHFKNVDRFYRKLATTQYQSELALRCARKFQKNRDELFTFLTHDGVAWHNNNAEHAIKAFVWLRDALGGASSKESLEEYLTLLGVCQTCKYMGLDFLDFLRSGETDVQVFAAGRGGRRRASPFSGTKGESAGAPIDV